MPDPKNEKAQPKDLDPDMLGGGYTTAEGVTAWSVGEDGDVLILGHHEDEATWAAFVAHQLWYVREEPDSADREVYTIERLHAAFSDHSEGCDLVECSCDEQACDPCRSGDHGACTEADVCECATEHGHEVDGGYPCTCECYCDEYDWWWSRTKSGHEVTFVRWSYEKARARQLASSSGQRAESAATSTDA